PVGLGKSIYFSNPTGVKNILTRITGSNNSNILGTLGVEGSANLFLINPNGIIFGENASLDIHGSFIATTADRINLGTEGFFSATEPEKSTLLTLQPNALFINALKNQQSEINNQANLKVNSGNNITLFSANITNIGQLSAPEGVIQLTATENILIRDNIEASQILINSGNTTSINNTSLSTSAFNESNSGNISITTKSLNLLNNSALVASSNGGIDAGDININATETVIFNNGTAASQVREGAVGNSGNISITTTSLSLLNRSFLDASTLANGNAGNITIHATDTVIFNNGSAAGSQVGSNATGNAGNISITTTSLGLLNGSFINTDTLNNGNAGSINIHANNKITFDQGNTTSQVRENATGNAGDISINTTSLELLNGSFINATTFGNGNAGSVTIHATDTVTLDNKSSMTSQVGASAVGNAGGVLIETKFLDLFNESFINASTLANGNAGTVSINATDRILLNNGSNIGSVVDATATGNAGDIQISSNSLILEGTDTKIFANTEPGTTGDSGNIAIDVKNLTLQNSASIEVDSQGSGKGGNIEIKADNLTLSNQAFISAKTISDNVGNLTLEIEDLLVLRNNSQITTTAGADGAGADGGNMNIKAAFVIAFPGENSDITANAFDGNGGNINITSNSIFGLEVQPQLTPRSDITASSKFGLSGDIQINTPDIDPTSGLVELPGNLVDAESLVTKDICANEELENSSFVITGKGGIAAEPQDLITNSSGILEWLTRNENQQSQHPHTNQELTTQNLQPSAQDHIPIQEAQGLVKTADGKLILTAKPQNVSLQDSTFNHPDCQTNSVE
ncbi:MAG: filamentous hemagglutinin N-terminal domain-containing protein, partial [Sphaerospermopsis sp. SIO1G2]|nr:filamentous hemagglutinin N-terminal domain-containing protein [Sphaerospermopsis sp. SIO1G2]